ncbi:ComF family protein [Thermomonas hydrothermalis]|uniref:double zinc ribbon domain-containing protein n=1 Tax=Thermomonas hydrothermalis TaxID=213588 RepID=UPI002352EBD1|nr:ComF family protein [Thermomonas hydrothermalis]
MGISRLTAGDGAGSLEIMFRAVNQSGPGKVDGGLSFLCWPPRCLICAAPGAPGRDLCPDCHATLPWLHQACPRCALPQPRAQRCPACRQSDGGALTRVHAGFEYAFPLDQLLPRLKFHGDLAVARVLAHCLAERFAGLPRPQVLVPVPLHRRRLRWRGYDQALELARPLARRLGVPLRDDLLVRRHATAAQTSLNAAARQRNLHAAFGVRSGAALPTRVTLFDDVMTTGATVQAAAQALRAAGVTVVEAWVCARVA